MYNILRNFTKCLFLLPTAILSIRSPLVPFPHGRVLIMTWHADVQHITCGPYTQNLPDLQPITSSCMDVVLLKGKHKRNNAHIAVLGGKIIV